MSNFYKRGFHSDKKGKLLLEAVSEGGTLFDLINLVNKNDNLVIQIRDNYFNIYYQGGNVAKVNSNKSVDLDENYFRKELVKDNEDWNRIKKDKEDSKQLFYAARYDEYLEKVQLSMKHYWNDILMGKGVDEKKAQHKICIENAFGMSDYTVIDLEYQVSTQSIFKYRGKRRTDTGNLPSPRFDIVAVRNIDHRLCIIELKKGTGALSGKSGVQEHAESFNNTVNYNEETRKAFSNELNDVVELKKKLGLIDKRVSIDKGLNPEYMFAYQFSSSDIYNTFNEQKKCFKKYQDDRTYIDGVNYAKEMKVIWLDEDDFRLKD